MQTVTCTKCRARFTRPDFDKGKRRVCSACHRQTNEIRERDNQIRRSGWSNIV